MKPKNIEFDPNTVVDWDYVEVDKHLWKNNKTGKFLYSDEASLFDETEYNTLAEAAEALRSYCVDVLGMV